jgi:hypothetical protein
MVGGMGEQVNEKALESLELRSEVEGKNQNPHPLAKKARRVGHPLFRFLFDVGSALDFTIKHLTSA